MRLIRNQTVATIKKQNETERDYLKININKQHLQGN